MIEEHLGKVLVSLSHFMPATLEEVKIGRIHDFILSCRGLYCFNNLNKISLPKYDRAIVIVKKKRQCINYYSVILCQHGPSFLTLYID